MPRDDLYGGISGVGSVAGGAGDNLNEYGGWLQYDTTNETPSFTPQWGTNAQFLEDFSPEILSKYGLTPELLSQTMGGMAGRDAAQRLQDTGVGFNLVSNDGKTSIFELTKDGVGTGNKASRQHGLTAMDYIAPIAMVAAPLAMGAMGMLGGATGAGAGAGAGAAGAAGAGAAGTLGASYIPTAVTALAPEALTGIGSIAAGLPEISAIGGSLGAAGAAGAGGAAASAALDPLSAYLTTGATDASVGGLGTLTGGGYAGAITGAPEALATSGGIGKVVYDPVSAYLNTGATDASVGGLGTTTGGGYAGAITGAPEVLATSGGIGTLGGWGSKLAQWVAANPMQAAQIGGLLGGIVGGKGDTGGIGGLATDQSKLTAVKPEAYKRTTVAAPAGYRPGFDPEHTYFKKG